MKGNKTILILTSIFLLSNCNNTKQFNLANNRDSLKQYKDSFRYFLETGNYPKAIDFGYKKLNGWKKLDSAEKIYESKLDLACIYDRISDSKKAIKFADEALDYFIKTKDTFAVGYIYSLLSAFHGQDGNAKLSKKYALNAIEFLTKIPGENALLGSSHNQLSCALADLGEIDSAIIAGDKAISYMRTAGRIDQVSHTQFNNGDNYVKKGDAKTALLYLNSARKIADSLKQNHVISGIDFRIAEAEELLGNYKKANRIINNAMVMKDSLVSSENLDRISKLEVQFKTKELELKNSSIELKNRKNKIIIYSLTIVFLIILIVLILLLSRYKKNLALKNAELLRNRDSLADYINLLINKNQQIYELSNSSEIDENTIIEETIELEMDDSEMIEQAENTDSKNQIIFDFFIDSKILTSEDWEIFKKKFNAVYPGYLIALRNSIPNLTAGEERHLLLIKANLNTKEIANILGIGLESVKKSRHRLRKKLNLDSKIDLDLFVANLEFNSKSNT